VTVAISLPVSIVEEVEKRRKFDSRSRYILRAVDRYLTSEEGQGQEQTGVWGSQVSSHVSRPATPTPTPDHTCNTKNDIIMPKI
jgi:metal-responsive CopG/Arc/MetJ family transcriptional regulator